MLLFFSSSTLCRLSFALRLLKNLPRFFFSLNLEHLVIFHTLFIHSCLTINLKPIFLTYLQKPHTECMETAPDFEREEAIEYPTDILTLTRRKIILVKQGSR